MAPVFKEVEFEWKGKAYKVTPTFQHIQILEQRISLYSLAKRVLTGQPPLSEVAELIAAMLSWADCTDEEATAEHIYAKLFWGDDAAVLREAATQVLLAFLPPRLPGNEEAPEKGASQQPTSTGENTTKSPLDTSASSLLSSGE